MSNLGCGGGVEEAGGAVVSEAVSVDGRVGLVVAPEVGLPPLSRAEGLEAVDQQRPAQRKRDQAVDEPDVVVNVVYDRSGLRAREDENRRHSESRRCAT